MTNTDNTTRAHLALVALLTVASILRITEIGTASLWYDEAVSFLTARLPLPLILDNTVQSSHPPLYYVLLSGWFRLFPAGDVTGRLLGTFFNLLLIPAGYLLTLELFRERRLALFVALLITLSPFHILYSHELRMYTLLMLLATLAAFSYLRARRTGRWRWWASFTLFSLAALYTHLFSAFLLMAIGIHALIRHRQRTALRNTILAGLILLVAFLPWILVLAGESQQEIGSLRPLRSGQEDVPLNPIKPLLTLAFLVFGQSDTLWYSAAVLFLTLALFAIFVVDVRKAGHAERARLLFPSLVLLCALGIPLAIYFFRPFFLPERTMALASPFLFVMLAWGIREKGTPLPYLAYVAVLLMGAGTLLYFIKEPVKPPYRQAIHFIATNRQEGDVVAHTSDGSYLPALSYVSFPQHVLLEGDPDMRKPAAAYRALGAEIWTREQIISADMRLWLIVALEHSLAWQVEQQEYFAEHFPLLNAYEVGGIQIYLYDLSEKDE